MESVELRYDDDRRRKKLKAKIAIATAQIEAGDYIVLNSAREIRELGEQIKLEGRRRLAIQPRS